MKMTHKETLITNFYEVKGKLDAQKMCNSICKDTCFWFKNRPAGDNHLFLMFINKSANHTRYVQITNIQNNEVRLPNMTKAYILYYPCSVLL